MKEALAARKAALLKADCVVFPIGVAIMRLFLLLEDARSFLLSGCEPADASGKETSSTAAGEPTVAWPPEQFTAGSPSRQWTFDDWLSRQLYEVGQTALKPWRERLDRSARPIDWSKRRDPRQAVEWQYTVLEVDAYIHESPPDPARTKEGPPPHEIGGASGARLWVGWNTAQIDSLARLVKAGAVVDNILNVFVVRSACWKLLTICGRLATDALKSHEESTQVETVAKDLRAIGAFAARLVSSYNTSLWTGDMHLLSVFRALDGDWDAEREVETMSKVLVNVGTVLEARRDEELRRQNDLFERRNRTLGALAVALAALAFISAIADTFGLFDNVSKKAAPVTLLAVAVPFFAVWLLWLLIGHRNPPKR